MLSNENRTDLPLSKKATETKKQIFNAAQDLLAEKPFEEITIRDIVARANVSIGTFYNYYQTKQDCYYETYIFADDYFENTVKPELAELDSAKAKVLKFFEQYAKYASEITDIKLTKILYNTSNPWFDRNSKIGMIPILVSVFSEGLKTGEIHSDKTAEEIAIYFMFAARGMCYNWCTRNGSYDLVQATEEYMEFLLKAVE